MTLMDVFLYGQRVGQIQSSLHGETHFVLEDAYRRSSPRPVLGQHFEDDLMRVSRGKKGRLPPFFSNLLPERDGKLAQLLARQHHMDPSDEVGFLLLLGGDLPGDVTASPSPSAPLSPADPLAEESARGLRFSLGGVQLKFSLSLQGERFTLPATGEGGNWLVKVPGQEFPGLVENEWSMMQWARSAGLDVPPCRIIAPDAIVGIDRRLIGEGPLFAIQRYDRSPRGRIHQEDFAQITNQNPERKYDHVTYERIGGFVHALLGELAVEEYLRRMVFVLASGNADAHLKNWSLIYPDRIQATWSPLYDQVAVVAWPDYGKELALKLCGRKRFSEITLAHVVELGRRGGLATERTQALVQDFLARLRDLWQAESPSWPLLEGHRQALRAHWQHCPLLRDAGLALV